MIRLLVMISLTAELLYWLVVQAAQFAVSFTCGYITNTSVVSIFDLIAHILEYVPLKELPCLGELAKFSVLHARINLLL